MDYRKRSKSNPLDDTDLIHYDQIFNDLPTKKSKIDSIIKLLKWIYKKLTCSKSHTYLNI
jgi:hypothetical protein